MRILIDASPLLLRSVGIKTYLYHWIQHLWQHSGNEQILTFPHLDKLAPLTHERSILSSAHTLPKLATLHLANHVAVLGPWITGRSDVFHVSNQIRNPPRRTKLTATIYDLTCRLMPEVHTRANIRADETLAKNIFRKADALIAISENTRTDAIRLLDLDPRRIQVIYPGVAEVYFGAHARPAARPYVLYVGTIEPRKNVKTLLDAWQGFRWRDEFDLVIAGSAGWGSEKIMARLSSGLEGVRYLGYVSEAELPGLTAGATVFIYPSLYEGFGFPVAQAMAAGVPVITSNTSSLPEVAGEGALLVDPQSIAEIQAALEKLLTEPSLRDRVRAAASTRARRYRWDECARESLNFFRQLA
jgi:glycosyltransferase involved in cell wall biosynthesis